MFSARQEYSPASFIVNSVIVKSPKGPMLKRRSFNGEPSRNLKLFQTIELKLFANYPFKNHNSRTIFNRQMLVSIK